VLSNGTALNETVITDKFALSAFSLNEGSRLGHIEILCLSRLLGLLGSSALPFACLSVLDEPNHSLITHGVKRFVRVSSLSSPLRLGDVLLNLVPEVGNELSVS
jgi:hypothetical protein